MQQLNQQFERLENIIVKLIDSNNKERQTTIKQGADQAAQFDNLLGRMDTIITVFQKLSGNGLNKHDR